MTKLIEKATMKWLWQVVAYTHTPLPLLPTSIILHRSNIVRRESYSDVAHDSRSAAGSWGRDGTLLRTKTILNGRDVHWLHFAIQIYPTFLISNIRALWHSALSARVPECQKLEM